MRNGFFRIGIDLMGADVPPASVFEAATTLPKDFYSDLSFTFFATKEVVATLEPLGKNIQASWQVCPEVVLMDENPLKTIREKRESSLFVGMRSLQEGKASAFITCANTGATVALARMLLDCFTGITRPALSCEFPTLHGKVTLLDVGGNVQATSQMLVQFATLGACFAHTVQGIQKPSVALLNIGEEHAKGTQELKRTLNQLMGNKARAFEFVGNKEPYDVFTRQADVFVTNGFTGNLFLKTSEAALRYVIDLVLTKYPQISPNDILEEDRGAVVLGAKKLVVKCHGAASKSAIQKAIISTKALLEQDALAKMQTYLRGIYGD